MRTNFTHRIAKINELENEKRKLTNEMVELKKNIDNLKSETEKCETDCNSIKTIISQLEENHVKLIKVNEDLENLIKMLDDQTNRRCEPQNQPNFII